MIDDDPLEGRTRKKHATRPVYPSDLRPRGPNRRAEAQLNVTMSCVLKDRITKAAKAKGIKASEWMRIAAEGRLLGGW